MSNSYVPPLRKKIFKKHKDVIANNILPAVIHEDITNAQFQSLSMYSEEKKSMNELIKGFS